MENRIDNKIIIRKTWYKNRHKTQTKKKSTIEMSKTNPNVITLKQFTCNFYRVDWIFRLFYHYFCDQGFLFIVHGLRSRLRIFIANEIFVSRLQLIVMWRPLCNIMLSLLFINVLLSLLHICCAHFFASSFFVLLAISLFHAEIRESKLNSSKLKEKNRFGVVALRKQQ